MKDMKDLNGIFCVSSRISSRNTMSSRGDFRNSSGRKLPTRGKFVVSHVTALGFLLVKNYGYFINYEILILSSNQIIFTLLGMFQLALWNTIFCWLCREYPRGINKHAVIYCKRDQMLHHWRVYSRKEQWWKVVQHLDLIWTWWHNAC